MKSLFSLLLIVCSGTCGLAQYAPQVGVPGSTAISATSSLFTGWATQCLLKRGCLNIDMPSLGTASSGDSSMALGPADHYIVSLGDSGVATLSFASPLYDGPGADFAVFENGFANPANDSQAFLEFAFVEVSSDGIRYVRFPATSLVPVNTQIPAAGVYTYANLVNNLAGKYIANYGTPFDLQELADSPGLDVAHISYVRLIDVVGATSGHSSYDKDGHIINDPYPTQFATGGFDLDAVGVIHQAAISHVGITSVTVSCTITTFPNPATDVLNVSIGGELPGSLTASLTTITGKELLVQALPARMNRLDIAQLPPGTYYLIIRDANGNKWMETVVKQ